MQKLHRVDGMRHLQTFVYIDAVAKAGSIRQAAEALAITQSALNRRILAVEEELGVPIFERLPRGVRLNTAGELLVHHIRAQISDMERIKSQIADLSGIRRGHVAVACSQALIPFFLPERIAAYRAEHPGVTFSVMVRDRDAAERALLDFSADVAVVFEPVRMAEFDTLLTVRQPIFAMMSRQHPLASRKSVRLNECLEFPLALPAAPYGVRSLLELAAARLNLKLSPAVQSDSFEFLRHFAVLEDPANAIAFQIPIGLPPQPADYGLAVAPVATRDVPEGRVHLAQLSGRVLPIASARFMDMMWREFTARYDVT